MNYYKEYTNENYGTQSIIGFITSYLLVLCKYFFVLHIKKVKCKDISHFLRMATCFEYYLNILIWKNILILDGFRALCSLHFPLILCISVTAFEFLMIMKHNTSSRNTRLKYMNKSVSNFVNSSERKLISFDRFLTFNRSPNGYHYVHYVNSFGM